MTPADRLARIRARAEAADEGPWYISDLDVAWEDHKPIVARLDASVITRHLPSHPPTRTSNNAEFLVHCVEDVPYLLERVAKLQEHIDVSTVSVDEWNALKTRAEALERVAADARTAVHYSRITIELAASIAALDALEQP